MIGVVLPYHLHVLAGTPTRAVRLDVAGDATLGSVLDALESGYPALAGRVRDPATGRRRPFVRFFACEGDLSHHSLDAPLPAAVAVGDEPLYIVGAMAGG